MRSAYICLVAVVAFPPPAATISSSEASSVWEQVIRAKGGRNRLQEIQNVLRSSRIPSRLGLRTFNRVIEQIFVLPEKHWAWVDERPTVYGAKVKTEDLTHGTSYLAYLSEASARVIKPSPDDRRELDGLQIWSF